MAQEAAIQNIVPSHTEGTGIGRGSAHTSHPNPLRGATGKKIAELQQTTATVAENRKHKTTSDEFMESTSVGLWICSYFTFDAKRLTAFWVPPT